MEYLALVYILIYLLYVIFGHSIIPRVIFGDKIPFPPIMSEIIRRAFFITYLSLLSAAYFLYNKTETNYFIALGISIASLMSYIIKYYGKELVIPPNGNYYLLGIIEHVIIIIPLLFYVKYFSLSMKNLLILTLFLSFYSLFVELLYNY